MVGVVLCCCVSSFSLLFSSRVWMQKERKEQNRTEQREREREREKKRCLCY
ncbi:hypothetical protein ACB098_07G032300 [Castanea mollissima]